MKEKNFTIKNFVFFLLIVSSFIPGFGLAFSTFGFSWTFYRISAALAVFSVLAGIVPLRLADRSLQESWILFMFFWLIYGAALLFLGRYSEFHRGFQELLSVFNGLVVLVFMRGCLNDRYRRETAIRTICWILNLMLLIALAEIASGKHLPMSAFCDPDSSIYSIDNRRQATGLMYNMNNFSAMITCMSTALLYGKPELKKLPTALGVLIVNVANNATTCTLALLLFASFYFLIVMGGKRRGAILWKLLFWFLFIAVLILVVVSSAVPEEGMGFFSSLARQIENFRNRTGSLFKRFVIYRETLEAWFSTGMLGMGPAGFSQYFSVYKSQSGLVNPHSFVLEILSQYGVIVAAWFLLLLWKTYHAAKRLYDSHDEREKSGGLTAIAFVLVFFIASFAPSAFIGYAYPWLMIAVISACVDGAGEERPSPSEG